MQSEKPSANLLKTDSNFVTNFIITKCVNQGFDNLTSEELAFTLINPSFGEEFTRKTGEIWTNIYHLKSLNKLKKMNIDLTFITNSNKCSEEFTNFFLACSAGNLDVIKDYFRRFRLAELMNLYDLKGKSPLHYAVKEGHMAVVEFLIGKGFNSEIRDRLFRTPLHLACLLGNAVMAEFLLRCNSNSIESKDLRGRGCIHFSSCASTSSCLSIVLLYNKEMVDRRDNYGRSALHYSVLNSSPEQLDFLRILLQNNANINAIDEDGRTALHYVADAGKTRAIPFLIQKGADLSIKDKKTGKTAIEMAATDRTRETIIVYSSSPYQPTLLEDRKFLARGVQGRGVQVFKENYVQGKSKPENQKKGGNCVVPDFIQNQFHDIMKKIQKNGVMSNQHIRKPFLFTGSWFEGVNSIEGLYERMRGLTGTEGMLRTFNILVPFEGELSMKNNEQLTTDFFYGKEEGNYDDGKNTFNLSRTFTRKEDSDPLVQTQKIAFENMIKTKELEIIQLKEEIIQLKTENEMNHDVIKIELRFKKRIEEMNVKLADKDTENKSLRENLEILKYANENLKNTINKLEQDKVLKNQKIKNLQKNMDLSNKNMEKLYLEIRDFKNGDNNHSKSQAIIKTKKEKTKRNIVNKKLSAEEDIAFSKLISIHSKHGLNLVENLRREDGDADGKLTRYEFTTFLQRYLHNPIRVYSLITFFGLNKQFNDLNVRDFAEVIEKRNLIAEKLEQNLLTRILKAFRDKGIEPENFDSNFKMSDFDADGDSTLNMSEFKGVLEDLGIVASFTDDDIKKLFALIDEDDSGSITLEEFKNRLLAVKLLRAAKSGNMDLKKELHESTNKIDTNKKLQLKGKQDQRDLIDKESPIFGELKIQFLNLTLQKEIEQLYIKARIPGLNKNWINKKVDLAQLESFKYACRIPIEGVLLDNIADHITFQLTDDVSILSQTYVNWKKTLAVPNKWIVNKNAKFDDESTMTVQLKYINEADETAKEIKPKPKTFKIEKNIKGKLFIHAVDIANLPQNVIKDSKSLELSIVDFEKDKETFKPILDDDKLIINQTIEKEIEFPSGEFINSIYCYLNLNKGAFTKDKKLMDAYIDFTEALNFPGLEMQTRYFPLLMGGQESKAKLQCIVKFITIGDSNNEHKLQGTLKIKVHRARNLEADETLFFSNQPNVDPYLKIKLKLNKEDELKYETKKAESDFNPSFNEDFKFDVEILKALDFESQRQILPPLMIELWDHDTLKDDYMGSGEVEWIDCFENPGEWNVNKYHEVYNEEGRIQGEVYLSCCYIPHNFEDKDLVCEDIDGIEENQVETREIKGKMYLRVVYLMNLFYINSDYAVDEKIKIKPYVEILFQGDKRYQTLVGELSTKNEEIDIYMINEDFKMDLDVSGSEELKEITLFIKHEAGFARSDKTISSLKVAIYDCVERPGEWMINQPFYLLHDPEALAQTGLNDVGRILLQAKFVPDTMVSNDNYPQLPDLFEQYIDINHSIEGKFIFHIVHCKDLPICDSGLEGDSCDPFIVISLIGNEKKKVKSKIIKNTLNPIFDQDLILELNSTEKDLPDCLIKVEVFDHDTFNGNELIGTVVFNNLSAFIENANKWHINRIYDLELKNENLNFPSQIYFQGKYIPKGSPDIDDKPPLIEDLKQSLTSYKREGLLYVDLKHAKGLAKIKHNGKSVDPYAKLTLMGKPSFEFTSKTVKKTNAPQFNELMYKEIKIEDFRELNDLKIEVFQKNSVLVSDQLIGKTIIKDVATALFSEKKDQWAINSLYDLQDPGSLKGYRTDYYGSLYLKIGFLDHFGHVKELKDVEEKENYDSINQKTQQKGILRIYLSHAKGLAGKDESGGFFSSKKTKTSDPYVKFKFNSHSSLKSKTIKKNLNPIFSEEFTINSFDYDLYNPGSIIMTVYDKDNFLNGDDLIGTCEISLRELGDNNNTWSVNKYFKLQTNDKKKTEEEPGEVYLQMGFFEEENSIDRPDIHENLEELGKQ